MARYSRFVFAGSVFMAAVLLGFLAPKGWANPGRAVYVNGQVHRIWVNSGSYIKHVAGQPRDPGAGDWVFVRDGDVQTSPWCASWNMMNGSGLAIFNNKIYYAYTSHSGCSGSAMYAYVCAFDLTTNSWTTLKRLGSVRTDLDSEGAGAGAAITVFDSKLYVFTDSGTYTSGDGNNWSTYASLLPGGAYQPLDALTFYPPDAPPRILIVYGCPDLVWGPANYYTKIAAATWNGQIGTDSDFPSTLAVPFSHWVYGHVSLQAGTMGAVAGYVPGAKTPSVQLFMEACSSSGPSQIRRAEFTYSAVSPGGSWRLDPYVYQDGDSMGDLWTYPWYTAACDEDHLSSQARQQTLIVHYHASSDKAFAGISDFMVPLNQQVPSSSCGDWGGQSTDTGAQTNPEEEATLRSYWSLYGVILGSPPFADNHAIPSEVKDLSNVHYGQSDTSKVEHTQQWENISMFSAGLEVHAGLAHVFGAEDKADVSYKHGLETEKESSTSVTTGYTNTLGTIGQSGEEVEELGRVGWAIFGVPKVMIQDFRLFAYDYDYLTGVGTDLDQDVHVVEVSHTSITVKPLAFRLDDPGGPDDDVPGLLSGMEAFPISTDLYSWYSRTWESLEMPWEVLFGDGTYKEPSINQLTFTTGIGESTSFITEETEESTSKGETSDVEIMNEFSVQAGTKLKGFKASLKTGYDSSFKTSVTNTTAYGKEVSVTLGMKSCSADDCVKNLYVQPYFLKATKSTAPWVPTAYAGQQPWCIAWNVCGGEWNNGTKIGVSPPPESGEGLVVGGPEEETAIQRPGMSRYDLVGACLGWLNAEGAIEPIPLDALMFDPSKGITVDLNGYSWSSRQAHGKWNQREMVWTFTSSNSVRRNKVTAKLDFGRGTWDFHISRADLADAIRPLSGDLRVTLVVNGKYTLRTDLRHHVTTDWTWERQPDGEGMLGLTSFEGWYDTAAQEGGVYLQGVLPEKLPTFGDMSFELNDRPVDVPLLDLPYFQEALQNKGTLVYDREGVHVEVDLAARTWFATIERGAFDSRQAPLRGHARIRVLVGGVPWGSFDVPVANFCSQLWLNNELN